ncbi:XTP/dITP diphosphatase [candidate division KSB1 bacterium]|nr:XTP/dITP diphosphatase [candidate division KSB1 bacterium]
MTNRILLIATKNIDKIKEISGILENVKIKLVSAADFENIPKVNEDRNTLQGNAIKKATIYSQATGLPAIADDTGLEVDALNGDPGVNSARYAGENAAYSDNVQKLLSALSGVEKNKRTARFRTVIAFADKDKIETVEGICEGVITELPSGSNGFGYDPVFYVPDYKCTFAEMDPELKNRISHRGLALAKLKDFIINYFK